MRFHYGNMDDESSEGADNMFHFTEIVLRRLNGGDPEGAAWQLRKEVVLMQMRLFVCVRTELPTLDIETGLSATGIGHCVGNKGGLVICLDVRRASGVTSLCFVSCHLAAHMQYCERRNEDCEEILQEARVRNKALDVTSQFDHCFWLGDLNYRVVTEHHPFDDKHGAHRESEAGKAEARRLVAAQDWAELMKKDQLREQQLKGRAFAGFEEGEPAFAPTFKVKKGTRGIAHLGQRTPSYCDRVLWKSMPHCRRHVEQLVFGCPDEVTTSDHKPVVSIFRVTPTAAPRAEQLLEAEQLRDAAAAVWVVRMEAATLPGAAAWVAPHVAFHSVPRDLLGRQPERDRRTVLRPVRGGGGDGAPRSRKRRNAADSDAGSLGGVELAREGGRRWEAPNAAILRPAVRRCAEDAHLLSRCSLTVQLYDTGAHFRGWVHEALGTALVSLAPADAADAAAGKHQYTVRFEEDLVRRNRKVGSVRGELLIDYDPSRIAVMRANVQTARRQDGRCCAVA